MNILYIMIHDKAKARWGDARVDMDNYSVWEACWFAAARDLREDFRQEGLVDTAQVVTNIILEQERFLPKKTESIPVDTISDRRKAFLEGK